MKIVCLLALVWIHTFRGATVPPCCPTKIVGPGGEEYILSEGDKVLLRLGLSLKESASGTNGPDILKIGNSETGYLDTASEMNGPGNFVTGILETDTQIVCDDDLTGIYAKMNASPYTYPAQCCENGTTLPMVYTCGNGTQCENVCGNNTCAKVVTDIEEKNHCKKIPGEVNYGQVVEFESNACTKCRNDNVKQQCFAKTLTNGNMETGQFVCPDNMIKKNACCDCKGFRDLWCCQTCYECTPCTLSAKCKGITVYRRLPRTYGCFGESPSSTCTGYGGDGCWGCTGYGIVDNCP